jgi:hypothetical protein
VTEEVDPTQVFKMANDVHAALEKQHPYGCPDSDLQGSVCWGVAEILVERGWKWPSQ